MGLARRWALVTGVSEGGLGDALTTELLRNGVNVIASALGIRQLDYLDTNEVVGLERIELDVTSASSISAAVTRVEQITDGRLDMLVNNAGYGFMMPLMDADLSDIRKNFEVNVFGLLAVTQAFFPLLKAAKGMVVNQSSIAGLTGVSQPFIGTYSASKSAVSNLSDTLRVELAPFGVSVSKPLCPGSLQSCVCLLTILSQVVNMCTGDVTTSFWRNTKGTPTGIPVSSPYQPIKAKVESMMAGTTNPPGGHDRHVWAKRVVGDLLRSSPPRQVRRGFLAVIMWMVSHLVSSVIIDFLFTQSSDLGKLKKMIEAEEGKKHQ